MCICGCVYVYTCMYMHVLWEHVFVCLPCVRMSVCEHVHVCIHVYSYVLKLEQKAEL